MEILEIAFIWLILLPVTLYLMFHFYRVLFKIILSPPCNSQIPFWAVETCVVHGVNRVNYCF